MIDFEEAIAVAKENAQKLLEKAKNFKLEGVILSKDSKLYEVSLSYDLEGKNPLEVSNDSDDKNILNMARLAALMGYRREYKTFLVDSKYGQFKGFKNYREE